LFGACGCRDGRRLEHGAWKIVFAAPSTGRRVATRLRQRGGVLERGRRHTITRLCFAGDQAERVRYFAAARQAANAALAGGVRFSCVRCVHQAVITVSLGSILSLCSTSGGCCGGGLAAATLATAKRRVPPRQACPLGGALFQLALHVHTTSRLQLPLYSPFRLLSVTRAEKKTKTRARCAAKRRAQQRNCWHMADSSNLPSVTTSLLLSAARTLALPFLHGGHCTAGVRCSKHVRRQMCGISPALWRGFISFVQVELERAGARRRVTGYGTTAERADDEQAGRH